MNKVVVKRMETEDEINGKGYVHYKSWHETYTGLVDNVPGLAINPSVTAWRR